ncbi:methyl-accepting chemotaxis protein [Ornithinibacillus bavariensis]|uniref:Sensory transducer protein YvaQ n=1 Tax=Ornithinibacillus bavariensis TaxID=545502 RepID=A0A919X6V5_9BACI|nr:HAMP domain-containing methyl-accepting chemotaxis protein [Ornithinibacillus bavariensis]GIO27032.1 putative sensory transducer protein YvaQ [Ornithinibacillus bavariensis]
MKIKLSRKRHGVQGKHHFRNISIGWKYGLVLSVVLVLFGISSIIGAVLVSNIGNNVNALDQSDNRALNMTELGSLTRAKSIRIVNFWATADPNLIREYEEYSEEFNVLVEKLRQEINDKGNLELLEQIIENDKLLNELFTENIVPRVQEGNSTSAEYHVIQANKIRSEMVIMLDNLKEITIKDRNEVVIETQKSQHLTFIVQLVSLIVSTIIGILLVLIISRAVSRNLNKVVKVSDQIASGDLSVEQIDYQGKDEIGRLSRSINDMSTNLREMIKNVTHVSEFVTSQSEELTQSANEVKVGSEQVASTMQELAAGTETQANSASDLANGMSQFSVKVKEASENGGVVRESSQKVLTMTEDGTKLMEDTTRQMLKIDQDVRDTVKKMKALDDKTKKITELVTVIRDVADQTNLLALNAAIEAARAGEHGKGFAVVADEVRKLAEQVSVSVTDITEIVNGIEEESKAVSESLTVSYEEVEHGTVQIAATGETLMNIKKAVNEMTDNISTITNNLTEIVAGSEKMQRSIEEIAAISEESAAGVEETSASTEQTSSIMEEVAGSSEELAKLSEELSGLVHKFKL